MKMHHALLALAAVLAPATAFAHFPFLHWTSLNDAPVLQIYFSESPQPGNPKFLEGLVDGKTWMKPAGAKAKPLTISLDGEHLLARPEVAEPVVFGYYQNWGKFTRGDEPFELIYYAKTYSGRQAWDIKSAKKLALDIRPQYKNGQLTATALWRGKPLAGAEIVVQGGVDFYEGKTNEKGQFQCKISAPALYAIRVRHVEGPAEGEELGRRHYATATIDLAATPE